MLTVRDRLRARASATPWLVFANAMFWIIVIAVGVWAACN